MNSFATTSKVEERSLQILRPFIQQRSFNGQYVVTSKGPLSRELQKTVGDVLYNSNKNTEEKIYSIEIKAEEENRFDNFFLETWSNRKWYTPGWMVTLKADFLFYHFLESDQLFILPFPKLKEWAWHSGGDAGIYKFSEKKQEKYEQANDTWGRCVPIGFLTRTLNLSVPYEPAQELAARAA